MNAIFRISRRCYTTHLRTLAGVTVVVMLSACATPPPAPTASLQAAQQAIASAESADASRYAPEELNNARTRLTAADAAVKEEKMIMAERLAEQSRADAELASAKAAAGKAVAVNDEMKRSTAALIEEMQRGSGDKQ